MTCPRCGAALPALPSWAATLMDPWNVHEVYFDGCPFERCDDPACRARKEPTTPAEVRAALDHWRGHHVDGGCAHGH